MMTYTFQHKFIFKPNPLPLDFEYSFSQSFEELTIETPKEGILNALFFPTDADTSKGVILYFHGNKGNLTRWGKVHSRFTDLGYDFFVYNYRGYGKSRGRLSPSNLYSDARFMYDYLKQNYPAEKIIIYGRSMGSTFATNLASKEKAKHLILETPFESIKGLFYTYYPFLPPVFIFKYPMHNSKYLEEVNYPVTIFQGDNDWIVPLRSAAKLKKCLKPKDEFILIPGGGHNDLGEYDLFNNKIKEILAD